MKKRFILFLIAITMVVVFAAGCGAQDSGTDADSSATASVAAGTSEATVNEAENSNSGDEKTEERVVASSVAVVEILDALKVPMVGVPTSSYELPASVKDAARIGNPMSPDMEVISSLKPTVVVSVDSLSAELKNQFENLKVPSEFVSLSSYDGLKESIVKMGERFAAKDKATALIGELESKEKDAVAKIEGNDGPSVLIIFGASGSFMVATENTYVGDLVKRVGGKNILSGQKGAFIPVDMEYLADKNPEYILFMAHANPEESFAAFEKEFETNKAWKNFDAVANGNVISLPTGYFGMSANLLAGDAIIKLADLLYSK